MQKQVQNHLICRYCGKKAEKGKRHYCERMRAERIAPQVVPAVVSDDSSFFVSWFVATTTDNWLLGYLAGGNMSAAIIGDLMRQSDEESLPVIQDLGARHEAGAGEATVGQQAEADADHTQGESPSSY